MVDFSKVSYLLQDKTKRMPPLLKFTGKDLQAIDFEPWLEEKPEPLQPLARRWFDTIRQCGPDVEAVFHDDYPIGCVQEAPFAYVNVYSQHVNVGFFYGAELPDESGILEGTGKNMRHVKLRSETEPPTEAIYKLIHLAYHDIVARLQLE